MIRSSKWAVWSVQGEHSGSLEMMLMRPHPATYGFMTSLPWASQRYLLIKGFWQPRCDGCKQQNPVCRAVQACSANVPI